MYIHEDFLDSRREVPGVSNMAHLTIPTISLVQIVRTLPAGLSNFLKTTKTPLLTWRQGQIIALEINAKMLLATRIVWGESA